MRAVSKRFIAAVKRSHTMIARATYLPATMSFRYGTRPIGVELPIVAGDVKLSSSASVRGTLDLTTTWPWGHRQTPVLPYGSEIYVHRGIDYGDGTREWVGLGYFRIESVEQSKAPFGELRITGRDRMQQVIDDRLEAPVQYAAGQALSVPVLDLLRATFPGVLVYADGFDGTSKLTSTQITDEKRWDFLNEIITSRGCVWWFRNDGDIQIAPVPNPDVPVWQVHAGPGGLLVGSSRELSRAGVCNAVVASGQTSDTVPPCRAVVRDMDERSPTYWDGPFGHVPRFFSSSFLQTDEQCRAAAVGLLAKAVGLPRAVTFDTIANPALEPWDPISLLAGVGEQTRTYVIDELTIPLVANRAMTGSVRDQTNTLVEGS